MAKLTTEQWAHVQATWESDPREGFQWLAQELGLDVSRPVLSRRAANNGWIKIGAASSTAPEKGTQKGAEKGTRSVEKGTQFDEKGTQKRYAPAQENTILTTEETTNNTILNKVERPVGRPTAYQSSYAEVANKLCLAFGATDAQLAQWFGVCEKTVNTWKDAHPEFLQSIQQGKAIADANVARKLYERATGYDHPDVHIGIWQGEAIVTPFTKHLAPDISAAKYWLNNRQPSSWRNQVEVEVSATTSGPTIEQLDKIYEAGMQRMRREKEEIQARKLLLAQTNPYTKEPSKY